MNMEKYYFDMKTLYSRYLHEIQVETGRGLNLRELQIYQNMYNRFYIKLKNLIKINMAKPEGTLCPGCHAPGLKREEEPTRIVYTCHQCHWENIIDKVEIYENKKT